MPRLSRYATANDNRACCKPAWIAFDDMTFRFSGAIELCLSVAGRRLTGNLPAPIVPARRLVSLGVCLRWLPVWLPRSGGPADGRLGISSLAARVTRGCSEPLYDATSQLLLRLAV